MEKRDITIIGIPHPDSANAKPTTIRRRYDEGDLEVGVHETLDEQVQYDTEQEIAELNQMGFIAVGMDTKQARNLKKQLNEALKPSNYLKIFATES